MSLDNPYPVYGLITDDANPVNSAHVYAQDTTAGSAIINMTTDVTGYYTMELMDIASNGDTITVWCFAPNGKYYLYSWVLDISGPAYNKDFEVDNYAISDTVNAATDALAKNVGKALSDTVNAATDTATKDIGKALSDTINAAADALTKNMSIVESDTIAAATESLTKDISIVKTDTVNAATDTVIKDISIVESETVNAAADTLTKNISIVKTETVNAPSDAIGTKLMQGKFMLRGYTSNEEKLRGYPKNEQKQNINKEE